jgi:hypothetical protein
LGQKCRPVGGLSFRSYPPYSIERLDENRFQISVALAGFAPDEVALTVKQKRTDPRDAWCPSLRAPQGLKAPVSIDDVLEELCALDDGPYIRRAASPCASEQSNVARPHKPGD